MHGLAGDGCDVVVVAVVVQHGDVFSSGYCSDEQVGEANCPDTPAAPEGCLDVERAPPVLVQGGEPFVAGVAVGATSRRAALTVSFFVSVCSAS